MSCFIFYYRLGLSQFSKVAVVVCGFIKAWFPLNVSVLATNWSCLLVRTLLCFAGFHRQPLSCLLLGVLYLEGSKSRSAPSIGLKITTFWKSLLFFWALFFLSEDRKYFLWPALSVPTGHSILRHRPCKSSICAILCTQAFNDKAGIASEQWCLYIERYRAPLCVLLTHVWKPGFTICLFKIYIEYCLMIELYLYDSLNKFVVKSILSLLNLCSYFISFIRALWRSFTSVLYMTEYYV